MLRILLIISLLTTLNCEIKKNPLAPNGPFGIYTLFYNFSRIGEWNYSDNKVLYYTINEPIFENSPILNSFIKPNHFTISNQLPTGLNFNSTNGVISGTPTEIQTDKDYSFKANFSPIDSSQNSSSLKINIGNYTLTSQILATVIIPTPFPTTDQYNNYSVTPSLPTGINLNQNTGLISGMATSSGKANYKIKATRTRDNIGFVSNQSIQFTEWVNEAYLKAPNAEASDTFGVSSIISEDTIVISATNEDSLQTTITNGTLVQSSDGPSIQSGAVYVYKRTGTTWANEAYLKAPNSDSFDRFGLSISISGDTIVVGAKDEDSNQTTITNGLATGGNNPDANANQGAAYVFRRTGNIWNNEAYLKAPNSESGDNFGGSVSISGDTIVVGAILEDSNQTTITNGTQSMNGTGASDSGAAYVFKRTGTTWTNEAYLKAPNAEANDNFGTSVSISGDTIVVTASGEDSNQTTITNGLAPIGVNGANTSGAIYVFRRTGTTWANEAYLKAPNAEASDQLGECISISGDTIVVGTEGEDSNQTTITNGLAPIGVNGANTSGAAYVFRRTGTTWANEAFLKAPNALLGDSFGNSVYISNDTIVIGASLEDSNQSTITNGTLTVSGTGASNSGAAYVFKRTGSTWVNEAYLKAPNAETSDQFGRSVSISGDTIVVTSSNESSNQTTITNGTITSSNNSASGSGAAYVFRRK
jgi:hypothetical protein